MYITYRNLSQLVHPSAVTFARYMGELPHARLWLPRMDRSSVRRPSITTAAPRAGDGRIGKCGREDAACRWKAP